MLYQDSAMFVGSRHCDRTQALERAVLPRPGASMPSRTTTLRPRRVSWSAQLAPMMPAPMMTTSTSKRCMSDVLDRREVGRQQGIDLRAALLHQDAAVDDEPDAGDVRRVVGHQEQ